jgi:hypothetical protein
MKNYDLEKTLQLKVIFLIYKKIKIEFALNFVSTRGGRNVEFQNIDRQIFPLHQKRLFSSSQHQN